MVQFCPMFNSLVFDNNVFRLCKLLSQKCGTVSVIISFSLWLFIYKEKLNRKLISPSFLLGFHCGEKEFQCDNGECVKNDLTCDGDLACKDESDEENCGCPSSEFACQDGKCIPAAAVCDGSNDCSDGDDEHNCRKFIIAQRTPREFSLTLVVISG